MGVGVGVGCGLAAKAFSPNVEAAKTRLIESAIRTKPAFNCLLGVAKSFLIRLENSEV